MDTTEQRFLQQLQAEHEEAKERFATRKERSREKALARNAEKEERGELDRQREIRMKFYRDNGYKRYISSRGKESWLLPEEYAWRMKARKARDSRHAKYKSVASDKGGREKLLWVGLVLIAMVIGLALLR